MYDLALSVMSCLRAGTRADVAWLLDVRGFDYRARNDALVVTPGGGRIGSLLEGALDDQLAEPGLSGPSGRLLDLAITDYAAVLAGLPNAAGTGAAHCLLIPAAELPDALWPLLQHRVPLALVSELDGQWVTATSVFTTETIADAGDEAAQLFARGVSGSAVSASAVITVLWPIARLVLVAPGPWTDALDAAARLLDWTTVRVFKPSDLERLGELTESDAIVIAGHDVEFTGTALARALASEVGYIGALGPPSVQRERAEWLADRGVEAGERIHGPAGLDIGARKPPEVAIAVLAEMLATRRRA